MFHGMQCIYLPNAMQSLSPMSMQAVTLRNTMNQIPAC